MGTGVAAGACAGVDAFTCAGGAAFCALWSASRVVHDEINSVLPCGRVQFSPLVQTTDTAARGASSTSCEPTDAAWVGKELLGTNKNLQIAITCLL